MITTLADEPDEQPPAFLIANVYVPGNKSETVVLIPVPCVSIAPGFLISVHVPDEGNPLNMTLPVDIEQSGCVLVPITGAPGLAFTVRVYVAEAAAQGAPSGLFVVRVITIVLPASNGAGV